MAKEIRITAIKYDLDKPTRSYTEKKMNSLLKYLPKHARKSASIRVNLEELSKNRDDKFQVEVFVTVPDKVLTVTGNATAMTSAIDIAESKMASQIRRYKTEILPHRGRKRGALRSLKERFFGDLSE